MASSYIEGLRTPLTDVAAAEVGDTSNATATWVADNLTAVSYALNGAGRNLTVEAIHEWHRRLMGPTGRLSEEMVGAFRTAQSRIGGTSPRTDPWVEWLAAELQYSTEAAEGLMVRSERLLEQWQLRTDDLRADATARQVLPVLVEQPVVSSDLVAERVAVSERAARAALATLAERDIVEPYDKVPAGPGRPRRYCVASELIDIVTNWGPFDRAVEGARTALGRAALNSVDGQPFRWPR